MKDISRLGLGCMGMRLSNRESSLETIQLALKKGIKLFNTGEFYANGESEMVLGEGLRKIPRNQFYVSCKFGMLVKPGGGFYGIDVNPWNVRSHLAYSLARLGLDYIDLYQPIRLDESVPIEELMKALKEVVEEGFVKHIGLTNIDASTLRRACAIYPVHTVEVEYNLMNRAVEKDLFTAAKELGVNVLAYGALGHGLISEKILNRVSPFEVNDNENMIRQIESVKSLKNIASRKGTTITKLAIAWTLAKYPYVSTLVGTTNPQHLNEAIHALDIELSNDDIKEIERAFKDNGYTKDYRFKDGKAIN